MMKKDQALQRLSALEAEAKKLREIIEAHEQTAKEWILDFLSKPFEVKLKKGHITYYRNGQWLFQQDLKNGYLWVYYYDFWKILKEKFGLKYEEIQALTNEVVGEPLNCKQLIPETAFFYPQLQVGEPLNCKQLIPYLSATWRKPRWGKP